MRELQASEAKTHLVRLLDGVERGETSVLTGHGRQALTSIRSARDDAGVLRLARAHQQFVYDAAYPQLPERVRLPLAAVYVHLPKTPAKADVVLLRASGLESVA
jgi:antitoxin (DNA-binding transcriptional repressor) of toxin-antitoxin stability system